MSRFYYERVGDGRECRIFDRAWSNTAPIALAYDENVAEMICTALNKLWEKPQ